MSKRKLPPSPETRRQHPSSPTPLPKPMASSSASSSSSSMLPRRRSTAGAPSSPPLVKQVRPRFWDSEGMDVFVDWITKPENHATLHRKRTYFPSSSSLPASSSSTSRTANGVSSFPSAGESSSVAVDRLQDHIREQCHIEWSISQIRSKLQYAKRKYDIATSFSDIYKTMDNDKDKAKVRRMMLWECPYYEQFHAIYGGPPLPPAPAPNNASSGVHSPFITVSSSSPSSSTTTTAAAAAATASVPLQSPSSYSQANGGGYTSPQEARQERTSTHVPQSRPSPTGDSRDSRKDDEDMESQPAEDHQSPQPGEVERDDEEEIRDQSPEEEEEQGEQAEEEQEEEEEEEEEAAREPSEVTYEMVSDQGMTSDHGHASNQEDMSEIESYRERSVALRTGDKGKGSSKRQKAQWRRRYPHHLDHEDRDSFMNEFKAIDSSSAAAAAAAGRMVWIEQDKERMRQIVRKEQMLEERESSWALRMLQQQEQHQAMLLKREEEADSRLKRRYEELEEERQKVRARYEELEQERAQVRVMQQELAAREKEFYKERETWLAGYAVLKADAAKAAALYHTQN
ncbi:hypothetical protein EC968_006803 [Mortierella alpina]|nr:hypothetical protein EC968_006803 [Mortierella alpina]